MKVLITGGTGTIGSSFIKRFPKHEYFSISRNETFIVDLCRKNKSIKNYIGSIEDKSFLIKTFKEIEPDIVIHAAAIKHIDIAEKNPIQTCKINIIGSLNVIAASIIANVPVTIGISTDKACSAKSIYGNTKALMEKCFLEANSDETRFAVCRFANVAHSNGSVLPIWLDRAKQNKKILLTSPKMNRLMFSQEAAAKLIERTINFCISNGGGFISSFNMKSVNMLDLARTISNNIEIIGARPGEKIDEDLINLQESEDTHLYGDFIVIKKDKNLSINKLNKNYSSKNAEKMTEEEIRDLIWPK